MCESSWLTFLIEPQILGQAKNPHSIVEKKYLMCSLHQCLQLVLVSKEYMKVSRIYVHFTKIVYKWNFRNVTKFSTAFN